MFLRIRKFGLIPWLIEQITISTKAAQARRKALKDYDRLLSQPDTFLRDIGITRYDVMLERNRAWLHGVDRHHRL